MSNCDFQLVFLFFVRVISRACDWHCYLDRYPDLSNPTACGANTACAEHQYLAHGQAEGRDCTCPTSRLLQTCDWLCYLDNYPDLSSAFGATNTAAGQSHYATSGQAEGRDCSCPNPSSPPTAPPTSSPPTICKDDVWLDCPQWLACPSWITRFCESTCYEQVGCELVPTPASTPLPLGATPSPTECTCSSTFPFCWAGDSYCYRSATSVIWTELSCPGSCTQNYGETTTATSTTTTTTATTTANYPTEGEGEGDDELPPTPTPLACDSRHSWVGRRRYRNMDCPVGYVADAVPSNTVQSGCCHIQALPPSGCTCTTAERNDGYKMPNFCSASPTTGDILCYVLPEETCTAGWPSNNTAYNFVFCTTELKIEALQDHLSGGQASFIEKGNIGTGVFHGEEMTITWPDGKVTKTAWPNASWYLNKAICKDDEWLDCPLWSGCPSWIARFCESTCYEQVGCELVPTPALTSLPLGATPSPTAPPTPALLAKTEPPTLSLIQTPSDAPTILRTSSTIDAPTEAPTESPSSSPTVAPIETATESSTSSPTDVPTEGPYTLGNESSNECPNGYSHITADQCKIAATTLGGHFRSTVHRAGRPTGCYWRISNGHVFANTHSVGSGLSGFQIICHLASATMVTRTTDEVPVGSVTLAVVDISGIDIGDDLSLSSGGISETKTVIAVEANGGRRLATAGTVTVNTAFQNTFPAGATVTVSQAPPTPAPLAKTRSPTSSPTSSPTDAPTEAPTESPTSSPTDAPTEDSYPTEGEGEGEGDDEEVPPTPTPPMRTIPPSGCTCTTAERNDGYDMPNHCSLSPTTGDMICYVLPEETCTAAWQSSTSSYDFVFCTTATYAMMNNQYDCDFGFERILSASDCQAAGDFIGLGLTVKEHADEDDPIGCWAYGLYPSYMELYFNSVGKETSLRSLRNIICRALLQEVKIEALQDHQSGGQAGVLEQVFEKGDIGTGVLHGEEMTITWPDGKVTKTAWPNASWYATKAASTAVNLAFNIQNVDFGAMTDIHKADMTSAIKTVVASIAGVPENNTNVVISACSVAVSVTITVPDQMDTATLKNTVDGHQADIATSVVSDIGAINGLPATGMISISGFATTVEATHTFEPGEIGIEYDEHGVVQEVKTGGQAHAKGITKGNKIVKFAVIGEEEQVYSNVALPNVEDGTSGYTVTFQLTPASPTAAPTPLASTPAPPPYLLTMHPASTHPTVAPTPLPPGFTLGPTAAPTPLPPTSATPTHAPTIHPTPAPPTAGAAPTPLATTPAPPTHSPTLDQTPAPTFAPTLLPPGFTLRPTAAPTHLPPTSATPTHSPTMHPSSAPSAADPALLPPTPAPPTVFSANSFQAPGDNSTRITKLCNHLPFFGHHEFYDGGFCAPCSCQVVEDRCQSLDCDEGVPLYFFLRVAAHPQYAGTSCCSATRSTTTKVCGIRPFYGNGLLYNGDDCNPCTCSEVEDSCQFKDCDDGEPGSFASKIRNQPQFAGTSCCGTAQEVGISVAKDVPPPSPDVQRQKQSTMVCGDRPFYGNKLVNDKSFCEDCTCQELEYYCQMRDCDALVAGSFAGYLQGMKSRFGENCCVETDLWLIGIQAFTGGVWDGGISMRFGAEVMLDEINKNPNVLPGFNLKVAWQDGMCNGREGRTRFIGSMLEKYLIFPSIPEDGLDRNNDGVITYDDVALLLEAWNIADLGSAPVGLLGTSCSSALKVIAQYAVDARFPVITNSATKAILSNRRLYPNLFRTIPSESLYHIVWLEVAKALGHMHVCAIVDNDRQDEIPYLEQAAVATNVTVSRTDLLLRLEEIDLRFSESGLDTELMSRSVANVGRVIYKRKLRIVVLMLWVDFVRMLLCDCGKWALGTYTFMTFGWYASGWWLVESDMGCAASTMTKMLLGSISANMVLWRPDNNQVLSCSPNMTALEFQKEWFDRQGAEFGDFSQTTTGHSVHSEAASTADAVCMYALMLHKLMVEHHDLPGSIQNDIFQRPPYVYDKIMSLFAATDFEGVQGKVTFQQNSGDVSGSLTIKQFQSTSQGRRLSPGHADFVTVATYSKSGKLEWQDVDLVFTSPAQTMKPPAFSNWVPLEEFVDCLGGMINMTTNTCMGCPSRKIWKQELEKCVCDAGYMSGRGVNGLIFDNDTDECKPCPPGKFSDVDEAVCRDCQRGRFADQAKSSACTDCPTGTQNLRRGSTRCSICPAGKHTSVGTVESHKINTCVNCTAGEYQPFAGQDSCLQCNMTGAACTSTEVYSVEGAWMFDESTFAFCSATSSCLGRNRCSEGNRGPLCAVCDEGWAKDYTYQPCFKCNDVWFTRLKVLLFTACLCLYLFAVVKTVARSARVIKDIKAVCLKIFLNYMALSAVGATCLQMAIQDSAVHAADEGVVSAGVIATVVKGLISLGDFGDKPQEPFFSAACAFPEFGMWAPIVFGYFAIPGLVFLSAVGAYLSKYFAFARVAPAMDDNFMITFVISVYSFYPSIINSFLPPLSCQKFGRGQGAQQLLMVDPSIVCFSEEHAGLVWPALCGLILTGIGLPAFFYTRLVYWRNLDMLGDPRVRMRIGFLYNGFEHNHFYWEIVMMLRKFILLSLLVFARFWGSESEILVVLAYLFFAVFFSTIHVAFQPFDNRGDKALDTLEVANLTSFLVTLMSASMVLAAPSSIRRQAIFAAVTLCFVVHTNFLVRAIWLVIQPFVLSLKYLSPQLKKMLQGYDQAVVEVDFLNSRLYTHDLPHASRMYLALMLGEVLENLSLEDETKYMYFGGDLKRSLVATCAHLTPCDPTKSGSTSSSSGRVSLGSGAVKFMRERLRIVIEETKEAEAMQIAHYHEALEALSEEPYLISLADLHSGLMALSESFHRGKDARSRGQDLFADIEEESEIDRTPSRSEAMFEADNNSVVRQKASGRMFDDPDESPKADKSLSKASGRMFDDPDESTKADKSISKASGRMFDDPDEIAKPDKAGDIQKILMSTMKSHSHCQTDAVLMHSSGDRIDNPAHMVTFQPGSLGLTIRKVSIVDAVVEGQAAQSDVEAGWMWLTIDGEPFSDELLQMKAMGLHPYSAVFMKYAFDKKSQASLGMLSDQSASSEVAPFTVEPDVAHVALLVSAPRYEPHLAAARSYPSSSNDDTTWFPQANAGARLLNEPSLVMSKFTTEANPVRSVQESQVTLTSEDDLLAEDVSVFDELPAGGVQRLQSAIQAIRSTVIQAEEENDISRNQIEQQVDPEMRQHFVELFDAVHLKLNLRSWKSRLQNAKDEAFFLQWHQHHLDVEY